jgi:hypothetical protein
MPWPSSGIMKKKILKIGIEIIEIKEFSIGVP